MSLILTDIDDTCLNFGDAFQAYVEARGLPTTGRLRDLWQIEALLGIPTVEVIPHLMAFTGDTSVTHAAEPCAAVVIPKLHALGHRFIGISACGTDPDYRARRIANLQALFGDAFEDLICVPFAGDKREALARYRDAVWVEDNAAHADAGARLGHRTFLLDRPYNRGFDWGGGHDAAAERPDAALMPVRVASWWEIHGALYPETPEDLTRMALSHGISLNLTPLTIEDRPRLRLDWIERVFGPPGRGRLVLDRLCAYADAKGVQVRGNVMDSEPALISLYEACGFAIVDADDDEGALMCREPR